MDVLFLILYHYFDSFGGNIIWYYNTDRHKAILSKNYHVTFERYSFSMVLYHLFWGLMSNSLNYKSNKFDIIPVSISVEIIVMLNYDELMTKAFSTCDIWICIRTTPQEDNFPHCTGFGPDEWFYSVVVVLVGSCPGGE